LQYIVVNTVHLIKAQHYWCFTRAAVSVRLLLRR